MKHIGLRMWWVIHCFLGESVWTFDLVVKASWNESVTWVWFHQGATSLTLLGHFAWHWASQCTDTRALILLHYLNCFFLGFCQWRSSADRVLTLDLNIWLPLFWSTLSGPRHPSCGALLEHLESGGGHGLGHMCWPGAWAWLQLSEQKWQKVLGPCFSLNCQKYWKTRAHPPDTG